MGEQVAGAALGVAFDLLFKSVVDSTHEVARFSSRLKRLKSTLCLINLAVEDIENFNKILERPAHETEAFTILLFKGEKLIRKCSKVKYWNVFQRLYYSKKLSSLEASLLSFFQIDVAALHFRESKRISAVLNNLEEKMNEMAILLQRIREIEQSCQEEIKEIVVEDAMEIYSGLQ